MASEPERSKTWWLWSDESSVVEVIVAVVSWQHEAIQGSELEFYTHAWRLDGRLVAECDDLPSDLAPDGQPISPDDFAHMIASGAVTRLTPS